MPLLTEPGVHINGQVHQVLGMSTPWLVETSVLFQLSIFRLDP